MASASECSTRFVALGAGKEIGRSCLLLELGGVVFMLDCGVHMNEVGSARLPDFSRIGPFVLGEAGNTLTLKQAVNLVDVLIISHCHLDHVAALPHFVAAGYTGPICMTAPTAEIAPLLISDYNRVVRGKRNRHAADSTQPLPEEATTAAFASVIDLSLAFTTAVTVPATRGRTEQVVQLTAYHAGHVLGAAMVHIQVDARTALYTGDFNCSPEWHLPAASVPSGLKPQLMICESTLAVTSRHVSGCSDTAMLSVLDKALCGGGRVLVPVHAVGRAQEILLQVTHHLRITEQDVPVVMVEGLASSALELYQRHMAWCSSEFQDLLLDAADDSQAASGSSSGSSRADADGSSRGDREPKQQPKAALLAQAVSLQEALAMSGPCVIFASPGMMGGGASQALLREIVGDGAALLLLPSFCVRGTLGEQVLRGTPRLRIGGEEYPVRCQVHNMSHSCHVDGPGILHTISAVQPAAVLLVHGEEGKMAVLSSIVQNHLGIPAAMPGNLEVLKM